MLKIKQYEMQQIKIVGNAKNKAVQSAKIEDFKFLIIVLVSYPLN